MESFERQWPWKVHTSLVAIFLLVTFTCACPTVHSTDVSADPASDVYEKLESYGFPEGLLPHIVTGYALEPDGRFTLHLASKCQVLVEGKYPLVYNKVITGYLSYGKLQGLKGITVKAFYIWWNISGIALGDDESLFFDIGILSTKFSCDNFDDPLFVKCTRRLQLLSWILSHSISPDFSLCHCFMEPLYKPGYGPCFITYTFLAGKICYMITEEDQRKIPLVDEFDVICRFNSCRWTHASCFNIWSYIALMVN